MKRATHIVCAALTVSSIGASASAYAQDATWSDVIWSLSACVDQFRSQQYAYYESQTDWFTEQFAGDTPFIERNLRIVHGRELTDRRFPLQGSWWVEYGMEGEFDQTRFFCRMIGPGPADHHSEDALMARWIERGMDDGVFQELGHASADISVCNAGGRLAHIDLDPSGVELIFELRTQVRTDLDAVHPIPNCESPFRIPIGLLSRPIRNLE